MPSYYPREVLADLLNFPEVICCLIGFITCLSLWLCQPGPAGGGGSGVSIHLPPGLHC